MDAIHKFTTMLAKTKSVIVVEDLSVRSMMQKEHDAKQVSIEEHCGRGVGEGDPPVALQDGVVRLGACDRPEVFSIHAAVFRVWECGPAFESFLPGVSLSFVWSCPGPRRERGEEPGMVRPVRSEPTGLWRVLCRRNGRKCSVYETRLDEAGSRRHVSPWGYVGKFCRTVSPHSHIKACIGQRACPGR